MFEGHDRARETNFSIHNVQAHTKVKHHGSATRHEITGLMVGSWVHTWKTTEKKWGGRKVEKKFFFSTPLPTSN